MDTSLFGFFSRFLVGSEAKFSIFHEVKVIFSRFLGKNLVGSEKLD